MGPEEATQTGAARHGRNQEDGTACDVEQNSVGAVRVDVLGAQLRLSALHAKSAPIIRHGERHRRIHTNRLPCVSVLHSGHGAICKVPNKNKH